MMSSAACIMPTAEDAPSASSTAFLTTEQVERLRAVLSGAVQIHGRGNFPTLVMRPRDLIAKVRSRLAERGRRAHSIRMNGGAASYVVADSSTEFSYSDIDLIFALSIPDEEAFHDIREAVLAAIVDLMPRLTDTTRMTTDTLRDSYVRKMVKVDSVDRWSLFSLHNDDGHCIELKFVDRMHRQFEFSVDSFQIRLDTIVDDVQTTEPIPIESVYGDYEAAVHHLNSRLIDTRRPEEIRGGGLLKYCALLARGYRHVKSAGLSQQPSSLKLQKYMCSRFFIDFPDVPAQEQKLRAYLDSHFGNDGQEKCDYMRVLESVVAESTVCLMYHERRLTLNMLANLANELHALAAAASVQQQQQQQYPHRPHHFYVPSPTPSIASSASTPSSTYSSPASSCTAVDEIVMTSPQPQQQQQQQQQHVPRQMILFWPRHATQWVQVA